MVASLQGSCLAFTPLCGSLPASVFNQGWPVWPVEYGMTVCGFQGQVINGITASVLVSWIAHSGVSQPAWCEDQAALWRGFRGEELRHLANSSHQFASLWVSHIESESSRPSQAFRCWQPWLRSDSNLMRDCSLLGVADLYLTLAGIVLSNDCWYPLYT